MSDQTPSDSVPPSCRPLLSFFGILFGVMRRTDLPAIDISLCKLTKSVRKFNPLDQAEPRGQLVLLYLVWDRLEIALYDLVSTVSTAIAIMQLNNFNNGDNLPVTESLRVCGCCSRSFSRHFMGESIPNRLLQMSIANVLVVDDDIAVCRIVHRMLSNEQYKVQTTQSVAEALAAIEKEAFDVFVMDYKLPDGSGLDVAERIRSKWGAAPIILISGYDPSVVALRAEKLRISDFLEKPFSREIICNAVKKAIGSPPTNSATASESERSQTKNLGTDQAKSPPLKSLWNRVLNVRNRSSKTSVS